MSKKAHYFDSPVRVFYALVISTSALAVLGLVMVFSASSIHAINTKGYAFAIAMKQFGFMVVGIFAAIRLSQAPIETWQKIAKLGLTISIAITAILYIPGVGKVVHGNRNWIDFKIFDVQPSEFAKFFLILWASLLISRKESEGKFRFSIVGLIVPGFAVVLGIILIEGDLGTASVLAGILAALLFISGIDLKIFGRLATFGLAGLAVLIVTQPYRMRRLTSFIAPFAEENYKTVSWQPAHSLLGMATGGLFGVGLGGSRQKWGNLPEAHTDFIYSVIGEELGLFGTTLVLALFIVLVYTIFKIALRAPDAFTRNVCVGIGSWIAIQAILNIGMAISVLPVIGITLPLVSYGGSALLSLLLAISFVLGAALRDKAVSSALVAKFAGR